jgi:hypothetical protein
MGLDGRVFSKVLIAVVALTGLGAGSGIEAPHSGPNPSPLGGTSCSTPTSCVFMGLQNDATGDATLQILSNNLVISNIDAGGDDGVDITASQGFTGTDDWIILGTVGNQPPNVLSTANGSKTSATSLAQNFGPSATYRLDVEDIGNTVRITSDFSASGATSLTYIVRRRDIQQAIVTGQPLSSAVTANAWNYRQSFSVIEWASPTTMITLPGMSAVQGDELQIIPVGATSPPVIAELLAFRITNTGGLATFTITEEYFVLQSVPAASQWALAATIAGMLLVAGWMLRRSR